MTRKDELTLEESEQDVNVGLQEASEQHHDGRDVVAHVPGDLVGLHVEDERGLDNEDHADKDQDQVDYVEDDDPLLEKEPENEKSVIASED